MSAARQRQDWAGALPALAVLVVGLAGMAAIVAIAYSSSGAGVRWSYRLGLPGVLLASAFMQTLILAGGWAIWRRLHPGPEAK